MKTLTKHTLITQAQNAHKSIIEQCCMLLGWRYEHYCQFHFEQYLKLIDILFKNYPPQWGNQVKYSPVFSGFWNKEAAYRNETEFLPFAWYQANNPVLLLDAFKDTHNPMALINNDYFMFKYNLALDIIRKENTCHR